MKAFIESSPVAEIIGSSNLRSNRKIGRIEPESPDFVAK